jgi:GNAT superfamily N-acetyltransferase
VRDALAWAEAHARTAGHASIEISVWDDDARMRGAIESRGYVPSGTFGPELVYRIGGEPPRPDLPDGYRFVAFVPSMDDAYVEMHRDAWSTIAPSSYHRSLHEVVTSMPFFDRALVPIVAAPDGTLAAYCIGWYDSVSRWTEIEPLGTRPAHREAGLAHAVVREVIHRSWQRGAQAVMVWASDPGASAHVNEPARKLYISSGMKPDRVIREYRRSL